MSFNSLHFLIFFALVLALYWVIPNRFRWILLLTASYYFYMTWNAVLVFLIAGTTLVSYGAAIAIEKTKRVSIKKLLLALTLIVCLGTLVFFKYFNFLLKSVIDFLNLFSLNIDSFALDLLLPVGISFYTFQTLSYVIDVYRGDFKAEKHLGYYALYVSYFPQLVAGPIERPGDLLPQLRGEHKFNTDDLSAGFRIMLTGFFRKCVVADFCGIYVNNVYNNIDGANSLAVLIASALFCVQMYCDFAGYSEIALGAAQMMGVTLTENFDRPYLAQSFTGFFRRWHITLNRWFTYYLYIPLGGNRKGTVRKLLNIFIVFALCGLWHGANWTYALWGIYVAVIMCLENVLKKPMSRLCGKLRIDTDNAAVVLLRRCFTFLLCIFGAVLFRSRSVVEAGSLYAKLFADMGFGEAYYSAAFQSLKMNLVSAVQIILSIAAMCLIYNFAKYKPDSSPLPLAVKEASAYSLRVCTYVYLILLIALCWITLLGMGDVSSFVYFQF